MRIVLTAASFLLVLAIAGCPGPNNPSGPAGPTSTPTNSPTLVSTATSTSTHTPTATSTSTSTLEPTATETRTSTPTNTLTSSPTATLTSTATPTATATNCSTPFIMGDTVTTGSGSTAFPGTILFSSFTASSTGTLRELQAYLRQGPASSGVLQAAIYHASSGLPVEFLEASATQPVTFSPTPVWVVFPMTGSSPITAGGEYSLCVKTVSAESFNGFAWHWNDAGVNFGRFPIENFQPTAVPTAPPSVQSGTLNFIANYCP